MWTRSTDDYYNVFETNIKTLAENKVWELPPAYQNPYPSVIGRTDEETRRNIHERELATARDVTSDSLITNLFLLVSHFR